jgi:hypothetical protein
LAIAERERAALIAGIDIRGIGLQENRTRRMDV